MSKKSAAIRRSKQGWTPPAENGLYVIKTEKAVLSLSEKSLQNFLRNNDDRVIAGKYIYRGEIRDITGRLRTDLAGDWDFAEWMLASREIQKKIDSAESAQRIGEK